MNIPCPSDSELQMFVEKALDPVRSSLCAEHVKSCRTCRWATAEYKQLLWDLEHVDPASLPAELDDVRDALLMKWHENKQQESAQKKRSASLLPAWAGYAVVWTRALPRPRPLPFIGGRSGKKPARRFSLRRLWRS